MQTTVMALGEYIKKHGADTTEAQNGIFRERIRLDYRPTTLMTKLAVSAGRCARIMPGLLDRITLEIQYGRLCRADQLTVLGNIVEADRVPEIFGEHGYLDGVKMDYRGFDALHQRLQMMPDHENAVNRAKNR